MAFKCLQQGFLVANTGNYLLFAGNWEALKALQDYQNPISDPFHRLLHGPARAPACPPAIQHIVDPLTHEIEA